RHRQGPQGSTPFRIQLSESDPGQAGRETEHASHKGSSSSLSRRGEEETQEEVTGGEPQFLFHGCKMPRML
ncbi:hypothetical protein FD755_019503, partial [Muntiacus reevesi]